ncbi:winged helix-turn-helix domain-containing protein, partial [Mycobacterium tuberculosis]
MSAATAAWDRRAAVVVGGVAEPGSAGPIAGADRKRLISRIQVRQLDSAAVAAKRRHLYYVRPLDGHPVARVDRKTDRAADSLPVAGVLGELDIPPVTVAEGLAGELASMASWLGLGG